MMTKSWKFYLCLALTLFMAFAAVLLPTVPTAQADELSENDALFAQYVEQAFYGDLYGEIDLTSASDPAGTRLTGANKHLYDYLKEQLQTVAANGGSTVFALPTATIFPELQTEWTAADLGVSYIVSGGSYNQAAVNALFGKYAAQLDWQAVLDALLVDCPYDLYWFKKNASDGGNGGAVISCTGANGEFKYNSADDTLSLSQLYATFYVVSTYQGGSETTVTDSVAKVKTAVTAANEIASRDYASDYERLRGFATEIITLSGYNSAAMADPNTPYGDPWQLIDVFDGDPNTKVVCEGFAKAFQYLCDLAQSKGFLQDVNCYIVTGYFTATGGSAYGAGPHMWNIVTIGNDSYLADITNCTADNFSLFLAGSTGAQNSSITSGDPNYPGEPDYSFHFSGSTYVHYWYAAGSANPWGTSVMTLAAKDYEEPPAPQPVDITINAADAEVDYTGTDIDVAALFKIPNGAGAATYTLETAGTTGNGTLSGSLLTVTKTGAFKVRVDTASSTTYNAGTATATLTVTPGTQAAPAAPTVQTITDSAITLAAIAANANGAEVAYSCDNGTTWQTSPVFSNLTPETAYTCVARYQATELYAASPLSEAVTVTTLATPTYTLTLAVPAFAALDEGYTQPDAQGLTLTGAGNSDTTINSVVLSGQDAASFTLNKTDGTTIAHGATDNTTYTVQPVAGLTAGTYTATVTVTYNGGATVSGEISFTVNAVVTPPVTHSVTQNLINLTSSFTDATIDDQTSLSVTLTAASGYKLPGSVTVKMEGTLLTAGTDYTYSDGVITLSSVTGDVDITAAGVRNSSGGGGSSHSSSNKHAESNKSDHKVEIETPSPVEKDTWQNSFADVKTDDWFYPAVKTVCSHGLMNGTGHSTFSPQSNTTRGMIVTVLHRLAHQPKTAQTVFADVAAGDYYAEAVAWAAEQNIVKGYDAATFAPNDIITREQLAAILYRYAGSPAANYPLTGFSDAAQISDYAKDAFAWACANNIITGHGDGTLQPQGKATRAEAAAMLTRYCDSLAE